MAFNPDIIENLMQILSRNLQKVNPLTVLFFRKTSSAKSVTKYSFFRFTEIKTILNHEKKKKQHLGDHRNHSGLRPASLLAFCPYNHRRR